MKLLECIIQYFSDKNTWNSEEIYLPLMCLWLQQSRRMEYGLKKICRFNCAFWYLWLNGNRSINLMVSYHSLSTLDIELYLIAKASSFFLYCTVVYLFSYIIICTRENEQKIRHTSICYKSFLSFLWLKKWSCFSLCISYLNSFDISFLNLIVFHCLCYHCWYFK